MENDKKSFGDFLLSAKLWLLSKKNVLLPVAFLVSASTSFLFGFVRGIPNFASQFLDFYAVASIFFDLSLIIFAATLISHLFYLIFLAIYPFSFLTSNEISVKFATGFLSFFIIYFGAQLALRYLLIASIPLIIFRALQNYPNRPKDWMKEHNIFSAVVYIIVLIHIVGYFKGYSTSKTSNLADVCVSGKLFKARIIFSSSNGVVLTLDNNSSFVPFRSEGSVYFLPFEKSFIISFDSSNLKPHIDCQ